MRMTEVKQDILYVRMLGSFSIQWNGKLIAGGSKASESQLTSLLQILIHNRARGVPRDRLEELLFEDRDMANVHHGRKPSPPLSGEEDHERYRITFLRQLRKHGKTAEHLSSAKFTGYRHETAVCNRLPGILTGKSPESVGKSSLSGRGKENEDD